MHPYSIAQPTTTHTARHRPKVPYLSIVYQFSPRRT
nr:MAG TPA: hypothetical protein [Caudoviricetes sp.]